MLLTVGARYASKRMPSQISILTAVLSKKYTTGKNMSMSKYVDEYNTLFSQLESMGAMQIILNTARHLSYWQV